ncbi:hypothetical protein [Paraburkholderia rhizosphaerae]|uniref:Uncharacterized protein n=1 Tax=Paraburkholderia rhizosphaerae TaxID=480658 RepID=A0A4R8LXV1_9BURK|nr:hypothetical protein [Paraburkholderia rhizosphaerae]TDY51625.1 hypothetical protein BX592_107193 [Paraburkholderia rhizosphaerae]
MGREQKISKLVATLPRNVQTWLLGMQASVGHRTLDDLSDEEWRALLRFLKALRAIPEAAVLPNPRDPRAIGTFAYALMTCASRLGRLPPGFSTGVRAIAISPHTYDDSLKTVSGMRAYAPSLVSMKPVPRLVYSPGRHNTRRVSVPAFFSHLSSELDSPSKDRRLRTQAVIRGSDKQFRRTQGLVYSPFISMNRDAIRRLAAETDGADLIVSLERGGSYVADQICAVLIRYGGRPIPHLRIPKPTSGQLATIHSEYHRVVGSSNIFKEFDKKTSHVLMLVHTVEQMLLSAPHRSLNLIVTETVVGGGSTNGLLMGLGYLLSRYDNLCLRLLLHRHTSHQDAPQNVRVTRDVDLTGELSDIVLALSGGQKLRLTNFRREVADRIAQIMAALGQYIPAIPGPDLPARNRRWDARVRVSVASGFYVLGEDIDVFLSGRRTVDVGGQPTSVAARVPVIIFRGQRGILIEPGCMMNSRQLLQMIVAGAFDSLIESLGIRIEEQPDHWSLSSGQRRGF